MQFVKHIEFPGALRDPLISLTGPLAQAETTPHQLPTFPRPMHLTCLIIPLLEKPFFFCCFCLAAQWLEAIEIDYLSCGEVWRKFATHTNIPLMVSSSGHTSAAGNVPLASTSSLLLQEPRGRKCFPDIEGNRHPRTAPKQADSGFSDVLVVLQSDFSHSGRRESCEVFPFRECHFSRVIKETPWGARVVAQ